MLNPTSPTSPTSPIKPRLRWRVLVRTGATGKLDPSRPSRPLSWHLVTCAETGAATAHCEEGQRLLISTDDPSGHCLLDGVCPRCSALESAPASNS
jgi:hypothetical protein